MLDVKLVEFRVVDKLVDVKESDFGGDDAPLDLHVVIQLLKQFFGHDDDGMNAFVENKFLAEVIF